MPQPQEDETKSEFITRCIPIVIEEGTVESTAQAYAVCNSIWEESKKDQRGLNVRIPVE